jgi:hypothetical protein
MVDRDGMIHSSCVSKWYTTDGSRAPHLLNDIEGEISSFTGDKGYDQNSVYRAVLHKNRKAVFVSSSVVERYNTNQ